MIDDKKRDTLFPIMQKYIAQRSFIMTDELKSYKECWEMNEAEETFLDGYTQLRWIQDGYKKLRIFSIPPRS
jgi:hypothetical protein